MPSVPSSEISQTVRALPLGSPILEVWLNGLYTCLVIWTLNALPKRGRLRREQTGYWTALVLMSYILATIHSTGGVAAEIYAFNFHGGDPSVISAFDDQTRAFRGFFSTVFVLSVLLSDILIIWRCWVIWEKRWTICVIPALTTITGTVMAILSVVGQVEVAERRTPGVVPRHFIAFSTPYFILSLVTSLYSTILIAIRVILVQREVASLGAQTQYKRQYTKVIEVIVESVALNSTNLIAFVILTVLKDENLAYAQNSHPQIAGIAPTLVLLRVALGHARPDSDWSRPRIESTGRIAFAPSPHHGGTSFCTIVDINPSDGGSNIPDGEIGGP